MILLPVGGGQIWKIKDDGTQLTQLTFGQIGHYQPEWNLEGTQFGCQAVNKGHIYGLVYDEFGKLLDSYKNVLTGCWQHKYKMLGASGGSIGYLDMQSDSPFILYSSSQDIYEFRGSYWMLDGVNCIVIADNGLYSFNTQTKKLTFLRQSCPNDFYSSVCVSFISDKILLQKDSWHYAGNNTIFIQSKLILMNTDGSGEVEIEL